MQIVAASARSDLMFLPDSSPNSIFLGARMYRLVWVSFCLVSGGLILLIDLQQGKGFPPPPTCANPTDPAAIDLTDRLILLLAALFFLCSLLLNNLNSGPA